MPILTTTEKAGYDTVVTDAVRKSDVINNLTSTDIEKPLSANMGKTLNDSLSGFRDPLNSEVDYKRVINSKRWSLINLSGLISIENTFGVTQGYIEQLLRTMENAKEFYFDNSSIVNKYFRFNYMHDIWMKSVTLLLDRTATLSVGIKWQASSDGTTWIDIGNTITVSIPANESLNFVGQYEIKISNIATKTQNYKYWRIFGESGNTTSSPYVNLIFPEIE